MTVSPSAVGIIAEYNPFHNGHAFHIRESKSRSSASYSIVVMSGDFVQRGAPAIYDKYLRTQMALSGGADLVLELPPAFAVSSAEDFASCAVSLLDQLGVVSHICFGSESGRMDSLMSAADVFLSESPALSAAIKNYVASGISYPKALEKALTSCLPSRDDPETKAALLSGPNNTLGIEYLKALRKRNSSIIPLTISRVGADYHDQGLSAVFSSASAVRETIMEYSKDPKTFCGLLSGQVPPACLKLMESAVPLAPDDFSALLSYSLLDLERQNLLPEAFADVSRELSARIQNQMLCFNSFGDRILALKTKQYTYARISRCLLHILLRITREEIRLRKEADYCSYVRVLGFRKSAAPLLGDIKRASKLPLITKTADAPKILSPQALEQFRQDLFCSHVYQAALEQKSGICPKNEYTRSVIVL